MLKIYNIFTDYDSTRVLTCEQKVKTERTGNTEYGKLTENQLKTKAFR